MCAGSPSIIPAPKSSSKIFTLVPQILVFPLVVALFDPISTSTSLIFNAWPLNCVLCSASSFGLSFGQYTPSLPLSQHLILSFNMPTLTNMQRHCTSQTPKRQFTLPHRAQGPFRPYTPRNVPLPSTVAPCVFVGVRPSSTVNNHSVLSLVLPVVKILVLVSSRPQTFDHCTYSKAHFNFPIKFLRQVPPPTVHGLLSPDLPPS